MTQRINSDIQGSDAYSVPMAAARIGISERKLRDEISKGRIAICRIGSRQLITPAAIQAYLKRSEVSATPEGASEGDAQ